MSDDVARVAKALEEACAQAERVLRPEDMAGDVDALGLLAPRVLAAIRAAANEALVLTGADGPVADRMILDAALAALTDHPGGSK